MERKEIKILILLAAVNFLHILDFMIMMPMGDKLMRYFHIGPKEFSLLVSGYTFSAGISGFLASFFIDRFDRKRVLITAFCGFLAGTLFCALSPTYSIMMVARILSGLFGGIIGSQVLSIVGDAFKPEVRGQATGSVMAGFSVASVLGVPIGLYVAKIFDWHMPFFGIVGFGLVLLLLLLKELPVFTNHLSSKSGNKFEIYEELWKNPKQQLALLFTSVLMFSHFTIIPFIAPYMLYNVGFTETQLAFIYIFGGGFTIFTAPLIGKLSDKYGRFKVFTIAMILSVFPILAITNLMRVELWIALTITTLFFIIAGGRFIPSQAMVISVVKPNHRGGFMSINSCVQQIGSGFAALIGGQIIIKQGGLLVNYPYVGFIAVFASILSLFIARRL